MSHEPLPDELVEALSELPDSEAAQLERVWSALGAAEDDLFPPADEAWRDLSHRIGRPPATQSARRGDRPPRRPEHRHRFAIAVVAALAIVIGATWWGHQPVSVMAPAGSMAEHRLPDGSSVTLAPASEVRYARGFRTLPFRAAPERAVLLRGEGFFEVAAAARPLVVETHDAVIEVLGTAFNVRARPQDVSASTSVAVVRGAVRLSPRHERGAGVVVGSGQRAEFGVTGSIVAAQRLEEMGVWREGGFSIHELPLADVLREIERRFEVTIWTADDLPYATPLTLYYRRNVDAEILLHDVALAAGLEYRPIRGGYEVSRLTPRSP